MVETNDGDKYIIKQEKEVKEFQPQNMLLVEARVAQELEKVELNISVPHVTFINY